LKPDEIRMSYPMFRELWARLVSKRKARKFEVDRHVIWQRLASGHLELRKQAAEYEAAIEELTMPTLSLDDGGQTRNGFNQRRIQTAPVKVARPSDHMETSASDVLQFPDADGQGAVKSWVTSAGKPTRRKPRGMSTPMQAATKTKRGSAPIKRRRTAEA